MGKILINCTTPLFYSRVRMQALILIHNPPTRVLYRSRHITKEPLKGCKSLKVTIIRAILLIAEWREEARVLISLPALYGSFRLSTAELSAVHIARCSLLTRAV